MRRFKAVGREKDIISMQGKQKAANRGLRCIYLSQRILNASLLKTALIDWGLP